MIAQDGQRFRILLVCNEPEACGAIEDILKSDETFEVYRASNGPDAMRLAGEIEADLMICPGHEYGTCVDCHGDAGEDTNSLLAPLFLLLAEGASARDIARSLEDGADDFIEKHAYEEILLPKIRSLVQKRRLQRNLWRNEKRLHEANDLLERNFRELTTILLKILEVRVPGASDRAETAKSIADFLTQRLGLRDEKRKHIIFAALLHEIGKIGLPDDVACKHFCNLPPQLVPVFQQHVTVGSMVISTITGYREAAEAVYHQLENWDGSGFPGELMGDEIPIGAKILRAIVFQEEIRAEGLSSGGIAERIRTAMHSTLDQRIANLLIEFFSIHNHVADINEVKVPIDELVPGMVIAEDVFAASGVKLLPKGIQLQEKTLGLLLERNETDPIIGGVYVVSDAQV
jgi:response regulator RpfG family c-di-GMP phosphodiesterase